MGGRPAAPMRWMAGASTAIDKAFGTFIHQVSAPWLDLALGKSFRHLNLESLVGSDSRRQRRRLTPKYSITRCGGRLRRSSEMVES
jgi:hypothetical protein